jgi:hypothetical protein
MKKYIVMLSLILLPLYAQSVTAGYDVSFGIVGEIGKAEITYIYDEDEYTVCVHAWTTGMASVLSKNREEEYISQGHIVKGILHPDVFVKHRKNDSAAKSSVYLFKYDAQEVMLLESKEEFVTSTLFDVGTMKSVPVQSKAFSHSEEPFEFFARNDLLSLFFNTQKILPTLKEGDAKKFSAIGSKSPEGIIDIAVPQGKLKEELLALMTDQEAKLITIIINQDIFQSEKGELHVNFDRDYLAKDVLLKDVILFGDIRGKRVYQNIKE